MITLIAHYPQLAGDSPCGLPKRTTAIIYGLFEITLLVCAVLTIAKTGAFSNIAEVHRINWISFGFGLLIIDLVYAGGKCYFSVRRAEPVKHPEAVVITDSITHVTSIHLKPFAPQSRHALKFSVENQRPDNLQLRPGTFIFYYHQNPGSNNPLDITLEINNPTSMNTEGPHGNIKYTAITHLVSMYIPQIENGQLTPHGQARTI